MSGRQAHIWLCHCVIIATNKKRDDVMGAQDESQFFVEANYAEKLENKVVGRSLLTTVGGEVEILKKSGCRCEGGQ